MKAVKAFLVAAGLAAWSWTVPAGAVHVDIGLTVEDGKIVAGLSDEAPPGTGLPIDFYTGRPIFEGDLEDFFGTVIGGDDPGFDAEDGTFSGELPIGFVGVTTQGFGLQYSDGTSWVSASPDTMLHMSRSAGPVTLFDTIFTAGAIVNDPLAEIGTTDAEGGLHQHVPFTLENSFGVPLGAYLFSLYVTADGYGSSDPFVVILNAGLDEETFETAVGLRAVPEPGTYGLLLCGLVLLGATTLRRRI